MILDAVPGPARPGPLLPDHRISGLDEPAAGLTREEQ